MDSLYDWTGLAGCQSSNGLKFNRYIANKEGNFCTATVKIQILILTVSQRISRYFKSHYFRWSSRTSGSWRISKLEKPIRILKNVFKNTLSRHYKTLQLAYIWKYFEISKVKGQDSSQNTTIIINLYWSSFLFKLLD